MELLRNSKDKKARKLTKKRVSHHDTMGAAWDEGDDLAGHGDLSCRRASGRVMNTVWFGCNGETDGTIIWQTGTTGVGICKERQDDCASHGSGSLELDVLGTVLMISSARFSAPSASLKSSPTSFRSSVARPATKLFPDDGKYSIVFLMPGMQ